MTDVTGFGVLGHGLEMARGSRLQLNLHFDALPLLPGAVALAREGFVTGASKRNWESYGQEAVLAPGFEPWQRDLLTDPQTSGGLLVACSAADADAILQEVRAAGYGQANIVGEMSAGSGARVI
jgi:selenide,water dikinase